MSKTGNQNLKGPTKEVHEAGLKLEMNEVSCDDVESWIQELHSKYPDWKEEIEFVVGQTCTMVRNVTKAEVFTIWEDAMNAGLNAIPIANVGILFIGNSGVGKSLLVNILLGNEAFDHRVSPDSVTSTTESVDIDSQEWGKVRVFNIPGLIEADAAKIERNKTELHKAFSTCKEQVVIFVFGNEGGRIKAEDIDAFVSIFRAYELRPESLLWVFNKTSKRYSEKDRAQAVHLTRNTINQKLSSDVCKEVPYVFVDSFGEDFVFTPDDPRIKNAQDTLLKFIFHRIPTLHEKRAEVNLNASPEGAKDTAQLLENMRKMMDESREKYEIQLAELMRQNQKELNAAAAKYERALREERERRTPACIIC